MRKESQLNMLLEMYVYIFDGGGGVREAFSKEKESVFQVSVDSELCVRR